MPSSSPQWDDSELRDQLREQGVIVAGTIDALDKQIGMPTNDFTRLQLTLDGLGDYAASWGDSAGVWLGLAVVKMLRDIIADYEDAAFGCIPPDQFLVIMPEEHFQEIAHQCVTAYQELYDLLLRTHQKPSSPIWHRRAVVQKFPQLIVENDDTGDLISDADRPDH